MQFPPLQVALNFLFLGAECLKGLSTQLGDARDKPWHSRGSVLIPSDFLQE